MPLTEKEIEVLKLRNSNLKQKEIAKKLNISQPAVSLFEKNARRKMKDSIEILDLIKKLGIKIK